MTVGDVQYAFGPVPSRRLGRSLGINNIPSKVCPYSCIYCQVGRTTQLRCDRRDFYLPADIWRDVQKHLQKAREASENVDYLAFVPDGEPTIDRNLGTEIALLKSFGLPVGVITNSALLWREDVRKELALADWVSLKVDTVRETIWRTINRPHRDMSLPRILEGMLVFRAQFDGTLVTETMLIRGMNDSVAYMQEVADFAQKLQPATAYMSIPSRPPAEQRVRCPDEETLNRGYRIFADKVPRVEFLSGYEGDSFGLTGKVETDLLGITAVHPMRESAVRTLLAKAGASWAVVDRLLVAGKIVKTIYDGHTYYLRKFAVKGGAPYQR